MKKYYLGIDTSNYTTSVAAVSGDGKILFDRRQVLRVREGERGLRQSQALFEHICNLPEVISGLNEAVKAEGYVLGGVGVSTRPRPVEGSYMPCFRAGEAAAKVLAEAEGVPLVETSHQEGHLAAALKTDCEVPGAPKESLVDVEFADSPMTEGVKGMCAAPLEDDCRLREADGRPRGEFIAFHLSGGTTEALLCKPCKEGGFEIEIIGGTDDISFGQLIDRVGVSLGMTFPCGREVDRLALEREKSRNTGEGAGASPSQKKENGKKGEKNPFCKIKSADCHMNISGIETQVQRFIKNPEEEAEPKAVCAWVLDRVGEALKTAADQARKKTGREKVLLMGGVSSSGYIRKMLEGDDNLVFGKPELCSDNAVGVALICAEACEGQAGGQKR